MLLPLTPSSHAGPGQLTAIGGQVGPDCQASCSAEDWLDISALFSTSKLGRQIEDEPGKWGQGATSNIEFGVEDGERPGSLGKSLGAMKT